MNRLPILFACVLVLLAAVGVRAQDNEAEFEKFAKSASESFLESSKKIDDAYKLDQYSRWDFDQKTRQIVFSEKGVKKVIADVQIAGSWAANITWLWAWDNKTIDDALKIDAAKVREFGKQKKYWELTTSQFMSELDHAWTLTAVAGYLTKAKTAYRGENGTGYVFFLITDLKWVK